MTSFRIKHYHLLIPWLVLLGLFLRGAGIDFGFPYFFHPDEPTTVRRALDFFRCDFNPRWFAMPSLYLYILHLAFRLYRWLAGAAAGIIPPVTSLQGYYLIGRLISVLSGTAAIALVWLCGKRLYGRAGAATAAALMAVAPLHVLHSHYATVDVPVTLAVLTAFYFSLKIMRDGGWANYLSTGVAIGISAGLKYNGAMAIMPFIAAHMIYLAENRPGTKQLYWSAMVLKPAASLVTAGLCFLASSPYLIAEITRFRADLQAQFNYLARIGHGPIFIATSPGALYNLLYNLPYAAGTAFWLLALAGFLLLILKPVPGTIMLLSWVVPYFILISFPRVKFSRFCLPLLPFMALLAGRIWAREPRSKIAGRIRAALLGVVWLWTFFYALSLTLVLVRTDARIAARNWIESELPAGSRIGMIRTETGLVFLDDPPLEPGHPRFRIERYNRLLPALNAAPDYLIVTDFDYSQILRLQAHYDQTRADTWRDFLRGEKGYVKLAGFDRRPRLVGIRFAGVFPPHDMMYNYPLISIYRRESPNQ